MMMIEWNEMKWKWSRTKQKNNRWMKIDAKYSHSRLKNCDDKIWMKIRAIIITTITGKQKFKSYSYIEWLMAWFFLFTLFTMFQKKNKKKIPIFYSRFFFGNWNPPKYDYRNDHDDGEFFFLLCQCQVYFIKLNNLDILALSIHFIFSLHYIHSIDDYRFWKIP